MNQGKRIRAFIAAALLLGVTGFMLGGREHSPEKSFGLSIGPRTVYPVGDFVSITIPRDEVDAVIASVVRHENWFGALTHAKFRYTTELTNTPAKLDRMRADLETQFPKIEITAKSFPHLVTSHSRKHTIAFDQVRLMCSRESSIPDFCQSVVWDGTVATGVNGSTSAPENYFLLNTRTECAQRAFESFPILGHAGSSYYEDLYDSVKDERPEISAAIEFEGRDCLVLKTLNGSWVIDRSNHHVLAYVRYSTINIFADHQQDAVGVFWPRSMTYRWYNKQGELETEVITTIEEFETENAPADTDFEQQLIPGIEVHDLRHSSPIVYPYDPNQTDEDRAKIEAKIAANEKRDRQYEQRRQARIGKPAPKFGTGRWLNSSPITLKDLRMRGAEIGFVGVACAPCENILPSFAAKVPSNAPLKILVFNSGDSDEGIKKKLAPFHVTCPVFVPDKAQKHPWGDIFADYGIQGMPTRVTIDGNGVLQTHNVGMFEEE